ncbi:MAG: toll/interleukin-1 receptor domain-containing protein, partial [Bacteroidales bacterium]|nr:toll/interleukin-1 receptor domain-containing protein [Bacteroidales bacterium]
LELRGYSVFLDFDELKDGIFDDRILEAIEAAPVFLFILSSHSLDRCAEEGDWVRKEVEYAYSLGRHIIPVNKDGAFDGLPDDLPPVLSEVFSHNQYSDIMLGQLFEASMEKMIVERIAPFVKRPRKWFHYAVPAILIAVAALIFYAVVTSRRTEAQQAADRYASLLVTADSLMCSEESLDAAQQCIDCADSLSCVYADTDFSGLFVRKASVSQKRLDRVRDSLFIKNRNYVEFYMARYRENRSADDKQKALHYIDRVLSIKDDPDLAAMRRILE